MTTSSTDPSPAPRAIGAVEALMADTLNVVGSLSREQWALDSGCHGWRVQDVVTHMAFFLNTVADPKLTLPPNPLGTTESLNDAAVKERAGWEPAEVISYYESQASAGLESLKLIQGESLRDKPIRLNDLGSYKLHQLAEAVAFDHLVHLTSDLLAPFGPLDLHQVSVAAAIDAAIDWAVDGLPKMSGPLLADALREPVGLRLIGDVDRSLVLGRHPEGVYLSESPDLPDDVATTTAFDFLRWSTRRSAWRSAVTIDGRPDVVAPALDAIRVI